MSNKIQTETKQYRGHLLVPLVIAWDAGTPSIKHNPLNEAITLTDNGTGDVSLTFADKSLAPFIVAGAIAVGANQLAIQAAPTDALVRILAEHDDGTAADPTELHLLIIKTVLN